MNFLLNVIWLVFGGFLLFLEYIFFGIVAIIFIVTIPLGIACFRIASYVLWPFGKVVVAKPEAGTGSTIMNVLWFLIPGWMLALGHLGTALFQAITIIGIPLAIANIKMIPITCFPFGKDVLTQEEARYRRERVLLVGPPA
ncbi:YccF domain-containing protein [Flaviflexus huanghaiensis]|uniref:YccF domain-containing protein n=1 Tax=Flaviflexus huanghaiensis TaxID=1111473 RepID=UPI0015F79AEA|nr:YccF domain-containing protein [Flaviflexus huanghaiensis]